MRTSDRTLAAAIALAAALPLGAPLGAAAQEAGYADPGPAVDPGLLARDTAVTPDSAAASAGSGTLDGWTYDELYASGISINEVLGADVHDPEGDDIGNVDNVLFDMEGNVLSIVAEIGGFLDIGDTHVNIPWEMVSAEEWEDGVVIPFTEDEVDDFVVAYEEVVTTEAAAEVQEVSGDGPGAVRTGADTWRATDLIGDFARLGDSEGFGEGSLVHDLVVRDGRIAAVLVSGGGVAGTPPTGIYGFPYAGQAGWNDAEGTYDMPYDRMQAERLQPFDPAMLTD